MEKEVNQMREAVIVDWIRTPVGRRKGMFSHTRADDLASLPLRDIIKRTGLSADHIEDVIMGCVSQVGEQSYDVARMASLMADYPASVPATTIDRQCGSSQQALHFAAQAVLSGDMNVVIAGGVENMTRVPMLSSRLDVGLSEQLTSRYDMLSQGMAAEKIADHWGLSRQALDEFSLHSHKKAVSAQKNGRLDREIMATSAIQADSQAITVTKDEGPRPDTNLDKLASLKPAFQEDGVVTAGNASQISDGAVAMLVMSREKAEALGYEPRFRITSRVVVGSDPTFMLTGPIAATDKILRKARLSLADIDIFEVNEAFASVPLAWLQETGADPAKLNPNGGAIALGHPLGASGGRLMCTLLSEMARTGAHYGLQTMCEGHGMANATIIEQISS